MHRRLSPLDLTLACGGILLVVLTLGSLLSIPLHIPSDYNEGWNAVFDTRAVIPGAGPLYPGSGTLVFNNYPPLGFLIVGAAGRFLFGDMIVAGRVIATLALLASGGLTGVIVRALGASRRAAVAAALLMLLIAATFYRSYVAMDDPQWLAHAAMLAGLAIILRLGQWQQGRIGWARIGLAAGIMVAGGFIKHNLVALPVALTLWLLWLNRRTGLVWILASAAWLAIGLALLRLGYGPIAFTDIFDHHRTFHGHLLHKAAQSLLPLIPVAIITTLVLRRRGRSDSGVVLIALFAAIALITGVLQRLGEGVYYNAQFETLIAICIGFGVALDRIPRTARFGPVPACLLAASTVIGALPWHLPIAWHDITDRHAREAAYRPMIAQLAAAHGPIGCEMVSLCYWAGHISVIDMFNLEESIVVGASPAALAEALSRHEFTLIQDQPISLIHRDTVRESGTDPIETGLARDYAQILAGPEGRILLAPKP